MKKCMLSFPFEFDGKKMALVHTEERPTVVLPDGFIPRKEGKYECILFRAAKETVVINDVTCSLMLARRVNGLPRFKNGTPKVGEQLVELAKKWVKEKEKKDIHNSELAGITILYRKF